MKSILSAVCVLTISCSAFAGETNELAKAKETNSMLVVVIESMGLEIAASARVNVARDAAQNRIRIFSTDSAAQSESFKQYGYSVEVVSNDKVATSQHDVASYHSQHNNQVFAFAGAQYASGQKAFGLWLIGLLAKAEPDLFWENPAHPAIPIKEILGHLEKGDQIAKDFLMNMSIEWPRTAHAYGPTNSELMTK